MPAHHRDRTRRARLRIDPAIVNQGPDAITKELGRHGLTHVDDALRLMSLPTGTLYLCWPPRPASTAQPAPAPAP